jgi:leader peptidase (prepilin peptidase) / N-methyltransferase
MNLQIAFAFGFGLLMGSFANVLIHRLPRMIMVNSPEVEEGPLYNLSWPASHCPHCQSPLKIWQNIPVISYVGLRGQCACCQQPIGRLYPVVEISMGLIWAASIGYWGWQTSAAGWALFISLALVLAIIDWQTSLLPDALTQTLVWTGLMGSALNWLALPVEQSVWGAVLGYGSLWFIATAYQGLTGKQGMGAGDFKFLAGLGAWLGPWALVTVVLMASISGSAVGLYLKLSHRLNEAGHVPFGPFLALAGVLIAVFGTTPFTF